MILSTGRSRMLVMACLLAVATAVVAQEPLPEGYCKVEACNKLERFTLDPWNWIKDSMGEVCAPAIIGKEDAKVGQVLSSNTRWYQGSSWNLTKRSVTRVNRVLFCGSGKVVK